MAGSEMNKQLLNVGFIGIGILGKGLALALADRGYRVAAANSRTVISAGWLADRIESCQVYATAQELADHCCLVFITTPDSAIQQVVESVRWREGQGVVHCSGSSGANILAEARAQGAVAGAFHPFQTFAGLADPPEAVARMSGVTFAVSAEGWLLSLLQGMARDLGGHPVSISDQDRPLYHASAVMACGYLVTLLQAAMKPWHSMGFTQQEAMAALYPLARATLENISKHGVAASVTGPVVRGDTDTVESHLVALSERLPDLLPIYAALASGSLPIAASLGIEKNSLDNLKLLIERYSRRCQPCQE
jgi:predicted short-subunit dehydrogenase-like oxidoreductase (DUF2520 family)